MGSEPYNFVMPAEEVVKALYRHLLGREPDPDGLAGWTNLIRERNDPTFALKGFLESEEYALRNPQTRVEIRQHNLAERARASLGRMPRIVDIGAQTLGPNSHAYDALMRFCAVEIIGFDPLQDQLAKRHEAEGTENLTLLPYAISDGSRHTLYVNNEDATSSLFPLNVEGNSRFKHLSPLHTVRTEFLDTKILDDVIPEYQIDYLKLDIQGGELMALQGATRTLSRTAAIHCEVEFYPIYKNQPLFADILSFLLANGFYFVDFKDLGKYTCLNVRNIESADRLLWADALFFRDSPNTEMRAAQALIADVIYGKPSLAAQLLDG
jgi:FkbM family methyltransferase